MRSEKLIFNPDLKKNTLNDILIFHTSIEVRYQEYILGVIEMQEKVLRKLFLGFIQIHILYHAKQEPFYGAWMIEELSEHGYDMSPGTLYPILHNMESSKLIESTQKTVEGRVRKYYTITELGIEVLNKARGKAYELFKEIKD